MKDKVTFGNFERELLKTAYREFRVTQNPAIPMRVLLPKMSFKHSEVPQGWAAQALARLVEDGYAKGNHGAVGPEMDQVIGLTGSGLKRAEELIEEGTKQTFLSQIRDLPIGKGLWDIFKIGFGVILGVIAAKTFGT